MSIWKKIIGQIKKLFGRKKLSSQELLVKRFEHLGTYTIHGEDKRILKKNRREIRNAETNSKLQKLKQSMKKSYLPPDAFEEACGPAMAEVYNCRLEKIKHQNGRETEWGNKEKGIFVDAKSGHCDGSGAISFLVHSVDKMLEQDDEIDLKIIALVFQDMELAVAFIKKEYHGRLEKRLEKYPGLEFQVLVLDTRTDDKPEKLRLK